MTMADYRQIHIKIWEDDWFIDLPAEEKVLFFWLFSNDHANVSGLFQFSVKVAARETGLSREIVDQAIEKFQADGKVYREGEWIWVVNLRKYNDSHSPNAYKSIMADVAKLPNGELKNRYLAYYQEIHDQFKADHHTPTNPLQAPSQPLPNPCDTPSGTENKEHRTINTNTSVVVEPAYDNNDEMDLFPLSKAVCETLRVPEFSGGGEKAWIDALEAMWRAGVIPEDIPKAVEEMTAKGKHYVLTGAASLMIPAIQVANERRFKASMPTPTASEVY